MTEHGKRVASQAAWRLILLSTLILAPAWDAAGLLVGDMVYGSPSYDVLRSLTPWGMRGYGPALALLAGLTLFALGRHSAGGGLRGYKLLRTCLSLLAAWYALWATGLVGAWWVHWEILSWGVGKVGLVSVIFMILARRTPSDFVRG